MKVLELETIQNAINNIKEISDNLDYNTSSTINKEIIKIIPLITKEIERMQTEKVTINCPKIFVVSTDSLMHKYGVNTITEAINNQLKELVINDYKIIDYNIQSNLISSGTSVIIKYTT